MIVGSGFRPAWWLPGPHLQTLWPVFLRPVAHVKLIRERLELPDGDFVDLDWGPPHPGPLVVVFHGLEGSSRSHYAAGILTALDAAGYQGTVMHFRGCSGEVNRLPRSYHAGDTHDMQFTIAALEERFPQRLILGIGYSMGGNALLKWLGQSGVENPLHAAVAVSVPFKLAAATERLEHGLSRLYHRYLLNKLRASAKRKTSRPDFPVDLKGLNKLRSLRTFDDTITAPLNGYRDVAEYYSSASSRQYLKGIQKPTLILHAKDDPFMTPDIIPSEAELSPSITLEVSNQGGHVGFIAGATPTKPHYWLENRIVAWLQTNPNLQPPPRT